MHKQQHKCQGKRADSPLGNLHDEGKVSIALIRRNACSFYLGCCIGKLEGGFLFSLEGNILMPTKCSSHKPIDLLWSAEHCDGGVGAAFILTTR